jgi:hypothetical protein
MTRTQLIIARIDMAEYRLCRELNRGAGLGWVRRPFQLASRLGDGIVWYVLIGALPLIYGRGGGGAGGGGPGGRFRWWGFRQFPQLQAQSAPWRVLLDGRKQRAERAAVLHSW